MSLEKSASNNIQPLELAFFGECTIPNLLDWLVTGLLCLILLTVSFSLGGSHVESQVFYLPLFALLLVFHALYLVTVNEQKLRINATPLYLIPFLIWALFSTLFLTTTPLHAWHEFLFFLEAFIFFWVATNNLKKRVHFATLLVVGVFPVIVALLLSFYQFFQKPDFALSILQDSAIALHPQVVGRSTGIFADPESFSMLILLVLPWAFVVTAVPRLPTILRVLGFYVLVTLFVGLVLSQTFWSLLVAMVGCVTAVIFCFEKLKTRIYISLLSLSVASGVIAFLISQFGQIGRSFNQAIAIAGEGSRLFIWEQTLGIILSNPLWGSGAGSFAQEIEQTGNFQLSQLVESPSSDMLLLLAEYGLLGFGLFVVPIFLIVSRAFERWFKEPSRVRLKFSKRRVMPPQRFFLTIALGGAFASFECFVLGRVWATPLLLLYNAIFLAILVKSSDGSFVEIKKTALTQVLFVVVLAIGGTFMVFFFNPIMRSAGHTYDGLQGMNKSLSLSKGTRERTRLFEATFLDFEEAIALYPRNGTALLGLAATYLQKYNESPSEHVQIGKEAADYAQRAIQLSPDNWRGWAYLGLAESMQGNPVQAEEAYLEGLKRAPSSSNANYYYAAFLAQLPERRQVALKVVEESLRINPANNAALLLKQKLLIK